MWNGSEGWFGRFGLWQKVAHVQQFPVGGIAGQVVRRLLGRGIVIGRRAAVLGMADAGMAQQVVLVIDDRPLTAHEQDGFAVRQQAHFIRREQVARGLLLAGAVTAAAAAAAAVVRCVHGLFADQFRNIFVGALLY